MHGVHDQPIIKIGHYILAETLGIGSFGKVKSTLTIAISCEIELRLSVNDWTWFIFFTISRHSSIDWAQSGCQNIESSEDQKFRCGRQNQTRNSKFKVISTSAYHQTVRVMIHEMTQSTGFV